MERRKFVRTGCCLAIGAPLAMALKSCGAVHYVTSTVVNDRLVVPKSSFEFVRKDELKIRTFVMISSQQTSFPICLYRINENHYSASLMSCTHNGCETNVQGEIFVCPCHGSEFSKTGKVLTGPAETDLQTFNTSIDDANIYIHLS